jgi:hypothetical protein
VRHRGGFAAPDIRMSFNGEAFEASAHQRVYRNPAVSFWAGPSEVMTRQAAEQVLAGFIETVVARLEDRGVTGTSAALRWARVEASRRDPEETAFCEAAGALGVDPYQITDADAQAIEDASTLFAGEPLTELMAGAASTERQPLLDWVRASEKRRPGASRVAELADVAREAADNAPSRPNEESWALGYRRARSVRRVLRRREAADRFRTFRRLAEALGARKSFEIARSVDGIRALRSGGPDGVHIHLRALPWAGSPSSYLFNFTRAVGDAACFPDEARAPINGLQSAYRQAAGRAFAAEFLAPINEIKSMLRDRRDADSIAAEFGVSTQVIQHQIENQCRIEAACT